MFFLNFKILNLNRQRIVNDKDDGDDDDNKTQFISWIKNKKRYKNDNTITILKEKNTLRKINITLTHPHTHTKALWHIHSYIGCFFYLIPKGFLVSIMIQMFGWTVACCLLVDFVFKCENS